LHTHRPSTTAIYTLSLHDALPIFKVDTALVFVDQPKQDKPPEQQPVQLDVPLKGFQTVVAPDVIPTNIPPVNLQEHFDPKDYSRSEEHTSELQSPYDLVCRLLLEK